MTRQWSKQEEEFLINNYGNRNFNYIKEKLNRTNSAIIEKAKKMGLCATKNNSNYLCVRQVSMMLNIDKYTINKWIKLKLLKAETLQLTEKRKKKYISMKNLIKFLKNNQEKWNSNFLETYALGEEPAWLIKKRKNENCNMTNYKNGKHYSKLEEAELINMIHNGKTYKEAANRLKRTEKAVAAKYRELYYKHIEKTKKV